MNGVEVQVGLVGGGGGGWVLWGRGNFRLEFYWWLIRVTLVVAFGFLPQNL